MGFRMKLWMVLMELDWAGIGVALWMSFMTGI
jgi:hypothetical protein